MPRRPAPGRTHFHALTGAGIERRHGHRRNVHQRMERLPPSRHHRVRVAARRLETRRLHPRLTEDHGYAALYIHTAADTRAHADTVPDLSIGRRGADVRHVTPAVLPMHVVPADLGITYGQRSPRARRGLITPASARPAPTG